MAKRIGTVRLGILLKMETRSESWQSSSVNCETKATNMIGHSFQATLNSIRCIAYQLDVNYSIKNIDSEYFIFAHFGQFSQALGFKLCFIRFLQTTNLARQMNLIHMLVKCWAPVTSFLQYIPSCTETHLSIISYWNWFIVVENCV